MFTAAAQISLLTFRAPDLTSPSLMFSRRVLIAALLALACVASNTLASGLESDPYTLTDGTVVDPTNPDSVNQARDNSNDSIYIPLSHDGPMGGMGPHQGGANTNANGGGVHPH